MILELIKSLQNVYHVTEAVKAMEETHCGW